jgi:hypothetical protein
MPAERRATAASTILESIPLWSPRPLQMQTGRQEPLVEKDHASDDAGCRGHLRRPMRDGVLVEISNSVQDGAWSPRALREPEQRAKRLALLTQPHVAPLTTYVAGLRRYPNREVPEFDPCDGGINARLLFLFEKPGPMTSVEGKGRGSGFISRDNDDPSAEATGNFMRTAGIPRQATVLWNTIPWWNGTIAVTASERSEGLTELDSLLRLVSGIRGVVLVGRQAELAEPVFRAKGLPVFRSAHPSARVRAAFPDKWASIPGQWRHAYLLSAQT